MLDSIISFLETTGIAQLFGMEPLEALKTIAMFIIAFVLVYLAIVKKFEPLLLLPIAIGILLGNLPGANLFHLDFFTPAQTAVDALNAAYKDGQLTLLEYTSLMNEGLPMNEYFSQMFSSVPFTENIYESLMETLSSSDLTSSSEVVKTMINSAYADGRLALSEYANLINTGLPIDKFFDQTFASVPFTENIYESLMGCLTSVNYGQVLHDGGFLDLLYLGVKLGIYPSLIFIGIGAMTDFTPLISNPKSLVIGAGAQLGVFVAFFGAYASGFFTKFEAMAIGIIGGADGPTAILVAKTMAPQLLGAIAIAAYSYMALIPMIQPPFMRLITTKKERLIKMTNLRPVSKTEKILFPIVVTFVVGIIVPDAVPLIGCLMFGNLLNVCGVTDRLSKTAQNELMNIVTIFLGISVGATASASNFLSPQTLLIIVLGLAAFCVSTVGGLLTAKLMCFITKGKINPLIGSAGVSAVPMAARVSQRVGQEEDPSNFLLMHAMGPNVAGVIGSAVAAGVFLSIFNS